jgi:hypothetical protein
MAWRRLGSDAIRLYEQGESVPEHSASHWLAVGRYELRSAFRRPERWQLTLLECPSDALIPRVGDAQLYRVDLRDWPPVRSILLDQDGVVLDRSTGSAAELIGTGSAGPLGLLRTVGDRRQPYLHIDSYAGQARFLRLPGDPVAAGDAVGALLAGLDQHWLKVSNYLCFRVNLQPNVELEHKFTLLGQPDVCTLARDTLALADSGGLPGWLVEFREEVQSWDFLNHVYAIEQPVDEAGYVSFIPTTDGHFTVKRKTFTADVDERPELRSRGVPITGDFADHVRDVLGLTPAWHASFRRTRHDVSVESIETGNAYVISYDRSTIVDDSGAAIAGLPELTQCEIEYIYSQSLDQVSYRSVRQDLATLRGLLSDYFDQRGIANYQRHESKLTFLRNQHVAA